MCWSLNRVLTAACEHAPPPACPLCCTRQIDLDTIDVTNLNRQFLFQKQHVGQSKAVVAGAAVERMNPRIRVTATHGNITEPERDVA